MSVNFSQAFPNDGSKGMTMFDYISTQTLTAVIIAKPEISKDEAAQEAVQYAEALLALLSDRRSSQPKPKASAL